MRWSSQESSILLIMYLLKLIISLVFRFFLLVVALWIYSWVLVGHRWDLIILLLSFSFLGLLHLTEETRTRFCFIKRMRRSCTRHRTVHLMILHHHWIWKRSVVIEWVLLRNRRRHSETVLINWDAKRVWRLTRRTHKLGLSNLTLNILLLLLVSRLPISQYYLIRNIF